MKNVKKVWLCLTLCVCFALQSHAQRPSNYTLIQGGSLFGAQRSDALKPMHGYQFHIAFGKNFKDKWFAGIGLGNDVYRGKNNLPNGTVAEQRVMTIPVYADLRAQVLAIGPFGRLGILANAGYSPSFGSSYMRGGMGKAGLSYSLMLAERSDIVISAGYLVQQFDSRYLRSKFDQQGAFIQVGLWVY
jgi:hypothetical protein